jgi:hypothetical protein
VFALTNVGISSDTGAARGAVITRVTATTTMRIAGAIAIHKWIFCFCFFYALAASDRSFFFGIILL